MNRMTSGPSTDARNFFASAISALVLLFVLLAFGLTMGSAESTIFSSERGTFTEVNPEWEPAETTAGVGVVEEELRFNSSGSVSDYTYVSEVYTPAERVRPGSATVNATLGDGEMTVYVFTSSDGFASIDGTDSFRVENGLTVQNLTFDDAGSFRFVLRDTAETKDTARIHDLNISGAEYRKGVDLYTPAYIAGFFTLLAMFYVAVIRMLD